MTYRVGIDTGGTFTDIVAVETETGRVTSTKTSSTPEDPSRALRMGLDKILQLCGIDAGEVEALIHGTTVATNALLEERFGSLALVTTHGFRHILEIARQSVPEGYGNSYFWVKPDRIVPLERVFEVSERLNFRGEVLQPLDDQSVLAVAAKLREAGITSVAVSLIHAYANAAHERRVRELLLGELPELFISLSSEVLPEYREYERTLTTCIDAYVKPVMRKYVDRAVDRLNGDGDRRPFLIMQSNGGVLSAPEVSRKPITTLLSGPAAGALGAAWLAGLSGFDRVLTVDAGGTSTDICLVDNGVPHISNLGTVGRFPVKLPMVDVTTIGTGGSSIAWLDPTGGLRVGPKSSGADPGPMAYGRGGTEPTLTDANLLLGRLPSALLGGEMALRPDLAREGIGMLAGRLGLTAEEAAQGIVDIADWNQVNAIRNVTVKRGIDPSTYVMVAFGGSGPLQAAGVAEILGMNRIVVPPDPGNVSALGLLGVDLKTDFVLTRVRRQDQIDSDEVDSDLNDLEEHARSNLTRENVPTDRQRFVRSADVRYSGGAYEVAVPLADERFDADALERLIRSFHTEHVRLYGFSYEGRHVCEIVALRVTGIGLIDRPSPAQQYVAEDLRPSSRSMYVAGRYIDVAVHHRRAIPAGMEVRGHCVVEEYGSTTVIPHGWVGTPDQWRNLMLLRQAP